MSVYLTGSAKDRVSNASGFINEVTDPSQFISRMPATASDVISDVGTEKNLKEALEDTGNPVYVYHKDGTKQFQEYYKGDYELMLTDFLSKKKMVFNRILSREEALTMLIDETYPDMPLGDKLNLALNDIKASPDLIKAIWGIKEAHEEVIEEDMEVDRSYPQLAESDVYTTKPIVKPKAVTSSKRPVFSKRKKLFINTPAGSYAINKLIETDSCAITVTADSELSFLEPETDCTIQRSDNTLLSVFYTGVVFTDEDTDKTYTIFVKD